ncbi:hypothetical protein PFISCL1PPCAC_26422, partial [Pristionchus fissidentatus]
TVSALLPTLHASSTCEVKLGCFENADCSTTIGDGRCVGGNMSTMVMGCCGKITTRTTPSPRTESSCVDKINQKTGKSDCARNVRLCTVAAYRPLMSTHCRKTCGLCGNSTTTPTPAKCADVINPVTGRSDCPKKRSICTHSAWISLMKSKCRATCGFCNAD